MPPGFGLLDTALVSIPIFLMLLGLIRGAPVELASCCGCIAGVAATWLMSCLGPVQALGQPAAPLVALFAGLAVWRLVRGLSHRWGFDTRWVDLGRVFDSFVGGAMGAARGLVFVSAACLSYAVICVPLGLANPMNTVAYPVFLTVGSNVTNAVVQASKPVVATLAEQTALPFVTPHAATTASFAALPLPASPPLPAAQPLPATLPLPTGASAPLPPTANGPGLAALLRGIAPGSAVGPAQPVPQPQPIVAYHADIPIRTLPVSLIETHHNVLHPFGTAGRRRVHR